MQNAEAGIFDIRSDFNSQGERCAGNLILPQGVVNPGVVILGHGFAAEREFSLPDFARVFAEHGYAAYYFDYRTFGGSEGKPRHWVSPARHQEDWRAAIEHVRQLDCVDADRVVLWGSSYGGGHVLQLASEGAPILAVISQVPHVSGIATLMNLPLLNLVRGSISALRDLFGSVIGRPYYSAVLGRDGQFAAMASAEAWDGYYSIIPAESHWKNRVLARAFLTLPFFSPSQHVSKIKVPVFVLIGKNDTVTPPLAAKKAAQKIAAVELHILDCNHFEPYTGKHFQKNISLQLDFLSRVMG